MIIFFKSKDMVENILKDEFVAEKKHLNQSPNEGERKSTSQKFWP